MKKLDKNNIWVLGPDDMPTCPECGSRCESEDIKGGSNDAQIQTCMGCGFAFITEIMTDEDFDND